MEDYYIYNTTLIPYNQMENNSYNIWVRDKKMGIKRLYPQPQILSWQETAFRKSVVPLTTTADLVVTCVTFVRYVTVLSALCFIFTIFFTELVVFFKK